MLHHFLSLVHWRVCSHEQRKEPAAGFTCETKNQAKILFHQQGVFLYFKERWMPWCRAVTHLVVIRLLGQFRSNWPLWCFKAEPVHRYPTCGQSFLVKTPKRADWEMKNCKSQHVVIFLLQFKALPVSMTPGNSLLPVCSMLPTPAGVSTRTIIRLHSYTICLTREHVFFQRARFPWSIRTEMQHMWNRSIIHILTALQVDLELRLWFPCRRYAGHLE